MTERTPPKSRDLTTDKASSLQKAEVNVLVSTKERPRGLYPLQKAERWCLWAFLVQLVPPWLLLGLAHIAYADSSVLSVIGEAISTHLLLGASAVAGLGMGGSGLYLLLRNVPWRRRSWGYAFLGWFALFAGIVYAQALLIFWVWA